MDRSYSIDTIDDASDEIYIAKGIICNVDQYSEEYRENIARVEVTMQDAILAWGNIKGDSLKGSDYAWGSLTEALDAFARFYIELGERRGMARCVSMAKEKNNP